MNNTDGWVTIGFKGDTKQLEKDIQTEERRLKQFEKESEKLTQQKAKLQIDLEDYEKQKQLIEETTKQNMMFASTEKGKKRIFAEENESMTSLNQKYSKQINQLNEIEDKLQRNAYQQGLINNNISEMNRELRQSKGLENIKNSMEGIIKKVKRWALAIFGVRSAYMFVRQAMSTLSESDEQLATNIEYIKWALATTIKPIIEWIVKAVYTVLSLIGSLVKAIFGVNIFANATADAFNKQKNELGGANKEAKQLQKTLAGFDEMNVLQDNGSVTAGGGGGGFAPEIDLSDIAPNSTFKKLKNFWKEIFDFWEKDWKNVFNNIGGKWGSFIQGLILTVKGFWDVLKGIGELIIGLADVIVGLVTGNFDLVKQGFNIMIEGIKNILIGAVEIITGLLLGVFGFVKGIFLEIWDFINNYFVKPVINAFSGLIGIVKKPFTAIVDAVKGLWDKIKKPIEELVKKINKALDKINPINLWDDIKSGAKSGWNKVKSFFGFAKGGIVVPKLATGGIINNPGSGVPLATAIGGERGAEGVIPLTDSQQMSLLGEAIGRYITVNLTNITELDGRQIARKVDKIQQNTNFVLNR